MESVFSWLNQPLLPAIFVRVWMVLAVGTVLLLVLIFAFVRIWRKKKKGSQAVAEPVSEPVMEPITEPVTGPVLESVAECTKPLMKLELANLQGIGSREEQQDAFGISPMDRYEEDGLLAVLCDGMGGMAEGGRIAAETVSELLGIFPWEDNSSVPEWVFGRSARVYRQFRGHGGTTLVAAFLKENLLSFWCVGDSDLFLLRKGRLYGMNIRQEFKNDLVLRALDGAFPVEDAFYHPQACCDRLEQEILSIGRPGQDNYTAIVLKYHGKKKEEL